MSLSDDLRTVLLDVGAKLVGFGDIAVACPDLPFGVSVALPLPVHIVREIEQGPTQAYHDTYYALNAKLNSIVEAGANYLASQGYAAHAQTTATVKQTLDGRTAVPHKTVATSAGLGWIGKSCLLITPQYGSAVRLSSLLTDAPLETAAHIEGSRCKTCSVCVDACPGCALSGQLWHPGVDRDGIVDRKACNEAMTRLSVTIPDLKTVLCGKCFVVCPYTQRYVRNQRHSWSNSKSFE